jgi:uncharacterized protein YllA (UPF0747 family)
MREDGAWMLRRGRVRFTSHELSRLREADPARFSPNVLFRPVVESALLPTICYVGGPAEVSYFAQIGPLFEAHGVMAPVVHPRGSAVLIEHKVRKILDKFDLTPTDFAVPPHELKSRVVRARLPEPVARSLDALRASARSAWDDLGSAIVPIDPTLEGWMRGQRNWTLSRIESAERKIANHLKKQNEVTLRQLDRAGTHLYPGGVAQERGTTILPYVARYGPALLDAIEAKLPLVAGAPAPIQVEV